MKKIFFIILIMSALAGCKEEFLESTPYGQSTSATFWRNSSDALAAANAMYEPLRDEEFYGHSEQTFEICSDDFWRAGDHGEDQAIEEFTFDPDNSQLSHSYRLKYEIVSRANAVLNNVPAIDMDQTKKNQILGEAYFMRGFAHWRLHVIYGEAVMLFEEDAKTNNYDKAKSSVEEMRAAIEADWKKAAELLPDVSPAVSGGRPTKGTAWGFLTKLYMFWDKLDLAIENGTKVISSANYKLAANYNANFTIATENNSEMLFAVQGLDGWAGIDYDIYSTPRPWGGWDFHEPIQDLVDEFEEGDPRLGYTVFQIGDSMNLGGTRGIAVYTTGLSQTNYHFRKFAAWRTSGGLSDDTNVPVLRAADVYLLVAEAKIRKSGAGAGDAELNAVRARAGMPAKTGATIQDLIHERRVELAGEAERHQDLMRWDRAKILDIVQHYQKDRGPFKPSRNFQRPKHYYFALPQREIDLSKGVLVQNPNY